jgi:hypothetical protein
VGFEPTISVLERAKTVTAELTDTFTFEVSKVSDCKVREKEHAMHLVNEKAIAERSGRKGGINAMPRMLLLLPCIAARAQHGGSAIAAHIYTHTNLVSCGHLATDEC